MVKVRVFVEGGGNNNKYLGTECRKGFHAFFKKSGLIEYLPRTIACGSRNDAYDDFCTALKNAGDNDFPILLVDSEDSVNANDLSWQHLKKRDNWDKPDGAADNQAHLMVQCMEAWFMADKGCVKEYFGQGFNENLLPKQPDIEAIPKDDLLSKLLNATRNASPKGAYDKGAHSFKLLALIDPIKVRNASSHAKRLLDALA